MNQQTPPPYDHQRWLHEMNREDAQRAHDKESEFFGEVNKATIDIGNLTLRTSVLINGGATIAVLGFIGAVISRDKFDFAHINAVAQSMIWFCYGIVSAVVGMAFAYLTNYFMVTISNSKLRTWQHPFIAPGPKTKFYTITNIVFHLLALSAAVGSMILFVMGMYAVRDSVAHLAQ